MDVHCKVEAFILKEEIRLLTAKLERANADLSQSQENQLGSQLR